MKKIIFAVLFIPALSWASFQPVSGSSVTIYAPNGNATAIPVSGTFFQGTQPVSVATPFTVIQTTTSVNGSTIAVVNAAGTTLALVANQSVNVAQMNGVAVLMNNGTSGTGSQRVNIASDNTAIAGWGQGATGSAVPSGSVYDGGIAKTSLPAAASDANLVGSLRDKFGRTVSISDCPRDLLISTSVVISGSTSETLLLSSGTAGVFNDLVSIVVSNSGSTASLITLRNQGFATTGWLHFIAPTGATNVGASFGHIWPQQSAASDWTVQGAASSSSIYVDAVFCQDK